VGTDNLASATCLIWTTHHEHYAHNELLHGVLYRAKRVAISQHGTSVLFTSHPRDGLVVNLYIPHNRRTPLQAKKLSVPFLYPGVPVRLAPFRGLVPLGRRNLVPILSRHTLWEGGSWFGKGWMVGLVYWA